MHTCMLHLYKVSTFPRRWMVMSWSNNSIIICGKMLRKIDVDISSWFQPALVLLVRSTFPKGMGGWAPFVALGTTGRSAHRRGWSVIGLDQMVKLLSSRVFIHLNSWELLENAYERVQISPLYICRGTTDWTSNQSIYHSSNFRVLGVAVS
jgi:hypothetical protein